MKKKKFCENISSLALKAILYEVAATPKPGLVDRNNSGSHKDMDFFTFLKSASVLSPYYYKCSEIGMNFQDKDYRNLLEAIRPSGIDAERDMFAATKGVNTHKGIIFSNGIISAASASLFAQGLDSNLENIIRRTRQMTKGISHELDIKKDKKVITYGEELFIKYRVKGIRGEVEQGFQTVVKYSYPIFKDLIGKKKFKINDIMVQTLLKLMAHTEDTNILGRHDMDTLDFVKESASKALTLGGIFTDKGKAFIKYLDKLFIKRNISPGGSADLLAVTLFIYMLENGDII